MDCEGENMDSRPMELVDHETDDMFIPLRYHANAVSLAKTSDKFLLGPGELEALVFDSQHRRHIASDHPTNVHAGLCGWQIRHG
jgi:hypothetical protein